MTRRNFKVPFLNLKIADRSKRMGNKEDLATYREFKR